MMFQDFTPVFHTDAYGARTTFFGIRKCDNGNFVVADRLDRERTYYFDSAQQALDLFPKFSQNLTQSSRGIQALRNAILEELDRA